MNDERRYLVRLSIVIEAQRCGSYTSSEAQTVRAATPEAAVAEAFRTLDLEPDEHVSGAAPWAWRIDAAGNPIDQGRSVAWPLPDPASRGAER